MSRAAAPPVLGPGTRLTNLVLAGFGAIALVVLIANAIPVVTEFPIAIDLIIPLKAAERWLAGGVVYVPDGFTNPEVLPPFLYPPFVLPLVAPLTWLPELAVRSAWVVTALGAAVFACRRLAIPWWLVPGVLLWAPMAGGIWGGNVQIFLFAAFVVVFWESPDRFDLRPVPRDLGLRRDIGPRLTFLAAAVASVKVTQAHAWLALAGRAPRAAAVGLIPWASLVVVTLPLVGLGLYGAWIAQVARASNPDWPAMGVSLLAYLPPPVFAALSIGSVFIAWRLRGPDTGAWLGLAMFLVAPNMHNFSGLLLLPAMLRIRREFALIAAILTSTYTSQGWWLGVAVVVGTMLAGLRWPILREPPPDGRLERGQLVQEEPRGRKDSQADRQRPTGSGWREPERHGEEHGRRGNPQDR